MIIRASGVMVDAPEGVSVLDSGAGRRGGPIPMSGPVGGGGAAGDDIDEALVTAMRDQDLSLVDEMVLELGGDGHRGAGGIRLAVPLGGGESGVILAEQDGLYRWVLPRDSGTSDDVLRAGGASAVTFEIPVEPPLAEGGDRRDLGDLLGITRVRTFVFRFVSRALVGAAVNAIDERVETGLMRIAGTDPRDWTRRPVEPPAVAGRPPRVLLLLHGTFSSTAGCFGALGGTPWGRAFLEAGLAYYDLVIGYDHKTLSEDPLANAEALADSLEAIAWPAPPEVDVVTHSRGGLAVRALLEKVLPKRVGVLQFRRAIFVGATNDGTELARPDNWHRLIDLYTSLAVATCRALALVPNAAPAAEIARGIVKTVGALVRGIVEEGLNGEIAPGLAAMTPGGDFLTALGEGPRALPVQCFLVAADFEPRVTGDHQPPELPLRLLLWAADNIGDGLMKKVDNDLVVDTRSMDWLGAQLEVGWADSLRIGRSPNVYHTNYFARPEVVNLLVRWLAIPAPAPRPRDSQENAYIMREILAARRGTRGRVGGRELQLDTRPIVIPHIRDTPANVDTDIFFASEAMPTSAVLDAIGTKAPSYVVLRRSFQNDVFNYAYSPDEVVRLAQGYSRSACIGETLDLHENERSGVVTVDEARKRTPSSERIVVVDGDVAVGVLPSDGEILGNFNTIELVGRVEDADDGTLCRRAMPSFGRPEPEAPPPPRTTSLNFGAEMPAETPSGETAILKVEISRETLTAPATGAVAARAEASGVAEEGELELEVVARRGFALDDGGLAVVPIPAPGAPVTVGFSLTAAREGSGSVWVIVRYDGAQCARLMLEPSVAAVQTRAAAVRATATGETGGASAPELTLEVNEVEAGNERRFQYRLLSHKLGLQLRRESAPIKGDVQEYVDAIYREIESSWTGTSMQAEAFERRLRGIGTRLWSELIPADLQKMLWDNRDRLASIQVMSEEPFIPWEMLCVVEPGGIARGDTKYFAEFGLVRWLWDVPKPPPIELRIDEGRSWYVIPSYPTVPQMNLRPLPEAEAEAAFLEASMLAERVVPLPADLAALLAGPDRIGFLHFAGHGFAASATTANPQIMLDLERLPDGHYVPNYLSDTDVRSGTDFGQSRPVVTLNACQAGRPQWSLTGMGGFAEAFLGRGAGMFTGTLWSVGDSPARTFSETLYGALLQGKTLAASARQARDASRRDGEASWLAYAVYGHPDAQLKMTR